MEAALCAMGALLGGGSELSCLSVGQKCLLGALLCSRDAALSIVPLIPCGRRALCALAVMQSSAAPPLPSSWLRRWVQRGGGRGACSVPRPLCKLSRSVGDLGSVPSSSAAQSSALSVVSQDGDAQTPQIPPSLTSLCAPDPSLPCPAL